MNDKNNSEHLPDELYVSFVESLYANRGVLVFGLVAQPVVALVIGESTGNPVFNVIAALFVAVGLVRFVVSSLFSRQLSRIQDRVEAAKWETVYLYMALLPALLMGVQAYYAILSDDSVAEVAAMTLTMATLVTIVGKNFASSRLVIMTTACLILPIFAANIQIGDWKHLVGAALLVPFAMSILSMSKYVREFLKSAVIANAENKSIADRFDVAINNMSHGLIMFDKDNRAIVVNKRAQDMIRLSKSADIYGRSLAVILRYCRFRGMFGSGSTRAIENRLGKMLRGEDERKYLLTTEDGVNLEFSANKIRGGGGVLLFEDISDRIEAEQKIQRMARFDALTGLPNRVHFRDMARSALASLAPAQYCAFFTTDLDDFKHVNDSLGHPVGDELLCRVADRINLVADDRALFSRFGGDEFVGLLCGFNSAQAAVDAAYRAVSALSGHYDVSGHGLSLTISTGIVAFQASDFELNSLMIRSDLALYESKSKGKGISTIFAAEMDERYQRRQRLKADLKQAIRSNSLKVFYQPIIDVHSMRISGCEALCRWDHPEFGPISPAVFIPIAEETGTISDLTRFMLEKATEDCATWAGDVTVAVNLSAIDFRSANLEDMIRVALGKSRLSACRLEVEVTEGAILEDQKSASKVLNALKATGVRISLDDFGTGYSSLSYLHNLPLDKVKIDQSFVREIVVDPRSLKLVAGVTHLANELGLKVTIEGIETLEQFERLREKAYIDLAQGYLFGAALSSRGIATLIENAIPGSRQIPENSKKTA